MVHENDISLITQQLGKPSWTVLSDALDQKEFEYLLSPQEKNVLDNIRNNPGQMRGYTEYIPNIVAKYYSWSIYTKSAEKRNAQQLKDVGDKVKIFDESLKTYQKDFEDLTRNAKLANGAMALVAYSTIFETRSKEHASRANTNMQLYIGSVFLLLLSVAFAFFFTLSDSTFLRDHLSNEGVYQFALAAYLFKASIIFFFFQVVQFCKRNYNAEKHLQETYQHRSDVLQSLHAVYGALETREEKDKLLAAGALFAYERGETGYITVKEGAGSSDGLTDGLFSKLLK